MSHSNYWRRGIFITINAKNNELDTIEAIQESIDLGDAAAEHINGDNSERQCGINLCITFEYRTQSDS